jgi:phenylacetic acid degradation operon negative regulatory protein
MADPIVDLLAAFTARRPMRAGSLIVTVFGDAILPRGGEVLLADLIGLLAEFALNESQVRTALSRLVADGWIETERLGRRSVYRLGGVGRHRFEEAARRIYFGPPKRWRGGWHVVLLPPGRDNDELRKDLGWLGFGVLAPGLLLHPSIDPRSLASVIGDLPAADRPLVIAGKTAFRDIGATLPTLVERAWDFAALGEAYRQFLGTFADLHRALRRGARPAPLAALLARIMLIHDYRRLVLRDPMLPPELMARDWIGGEAYAMARALYRALAAPAERWIGANLHVADGSLPAADANSRRRFP